jgi:hypothetical protein
MSKNDKKRRIIIEIIGGIILLAIIIFLVFFLNRKYEVSFYLDNGSDTQVVYVKHNKILNSNNIKGKEDLGESFVDWYEIVNVKYPNGNAPSLVYTNDKTTINVALVMNDVTMKNNQIEEYVKTMESTYKNYSKDVKLNFWERNNHKIGEMEFTTQGSDTEIYNHIITFSVNDKLRLVNFNCTKEQMNEWQKVSKFIMDSIMFE